MAKQIYNSLLEELNKYVPIEPSESKLEELDESDIPIDQITVAVAKRIAEAKRKGLSALLDSTKRWT